MAGVNVVELSLIAASGHQAPAGAHVLIMIVIVAGVAVALLAARRHRGDDELPDTTPAAASEREPSER